MLGKTKMNLFRDFGRYALFWIPFMLWAPFTMVMAAVGFRQTLSDWELSGFLELGYFRKWIGMAYILSVLGFPMIGSGLLIRRAYSMGWRDRGKAEASEHP